MQKCIPMYLILFLEQEKAEDAEIDHDAIAHRLKEDFVCVTDHL